MSSASRSSKKKPVPKKPAPKKPRFELKPVKTPRPGKPRKDGKPARIRAKTLPLGVRRTILDMIDEGKTVAQIKQRFKRYSPTKAQIDSIRYGRTKTVKTPRTDSNNYPHSEPVQRSNDANVLIRDGLVEALNVLNRRTAKNPDARIETLRDASLINQRVTRSSLMSNMGRRDADVILEIIRMYEHTATEADAITIYKQALDRVQRREKENA